MELPIQVLQNDSEALDLNNAGDKCSFVIVRPMRVKTVGVIPLTTDAGGATVKFDKRPTAGSDTSRGDGDVGSVIIPASAQQGKKVWAAPSSEVILQPGDEVVVEVATGEGAAVNSFFKPFIEYYAVSESLVNQDDAVESA